MYKKLINKFIILILFTTIFLTNTNSVYALSIDELYVNAYRAVVEATQTGTQEKVTAARIAIKPLLDAYNAGETWLESQIGTLSSMVDKVQQDLFNDFYRIIYETIDGKVVLKEVLIQSEIDRAREYVFAFKTYDGNTEYINTWSDAVDRFQQNKYDVAYTAVLKASETKSQSDIESARLLLNELATSNNGDVISWVRIVEIKLNSISGNKTGYVYNTDFQFDLNVRTAPNLNGDIVGKLYNYNRIEILDTIVDASNNVWDKIIYNGSFAYVSDAYIQQYTSPSDAVVNIAKNITKQFEVGISNQIAGNFDGQGLSLGYFQWCIGQGTLQPLLNRMDRQYNSEMRVVFGSNYDTVHNMILDTSENQLKWAKSINNSTNKIVEPWYSQFVSLSKDKNFISIEQDAEVYMVKQAMIICDKYKLKTVRGFALALDIVVQNGSINSEATKTIDIAIAKTPNMTEKNLLGVIANAVADSSPNNTEDIRSRKMAIVNGKGIVHGEMLNLDTNYGLSDDCWR
ncbi:MAG: SH3 domain-containing protein [Clostridium sp.]|uniref:SH3 domain-containing protein n=1 Tax=Clostridium sp. TaxID=1506 RepID=UPI003022ED49